MFLHGTICIRCSVVNDLKQDLNCVPSYSQGSPYKRAPGGLLWGRGGRRLVLFAGLRLPPRAEEEEEAVGGGGGGEEEGARGGRVQQEGVRAQLG